MIDPGFIPRWSGSTVYAVTHLSAANLAPGGCVTSEKSMTLFIVHTQRVKAITVDTKGSQRPEILSDVLSSHENPKLEGVLRKSPVLIGVYWEVSDRKKTNICWAPDM